MKTIELPYSTSSTSLGPIVEMEDSNLIIRYDYEDEEGQIFWTKINFEIVYGYKYIETEYITTVDYKFGLVEIEDSKWIKKLLGIWTKKGQHPENSFGSEPEKVHHYRVYFDDDGLHEIICKNIKIEVS